MDVNLRFCQLMLKSAMETLTKEERADFRANSGVLKYRMGGTNTCYLVEWSKKDSTTGGTYAWEDHADNVYDAKAKAINHWVEHHAPKFRDPNAVIPGQVWKTNRKHHNIRVVKVEGERAEVYRVSWNERAKAWERDALARYTWTNLTSFRKFQKVA